MQINCPNCNAGYQIDDKLIENKSRRLKCSNCGEVFTVNQLNQKAPEEELVQENPFDALAAAMQEVSERQDYSEEGAVEQIDETSISEQSIEPADIKEALSDTDISVSEVSEIQKESEKVETIEENIEVANSSESDAENTDNEDNKEAVDENIDLEKIFERLSEHTERLIEQEKKLPFYEKVWLQIKNILGFHFKIKWSYIFVALFVFVVISLYNNRYQIVREVPFLNGMYKALEIKAKIPGEGLEFQNINWDFINDEDGTRLEVKGFIYNLTDKDIEIPVVHIEILDKETLLLQSQNRDIEDNVVESHAKIPLKLVLANPASTAKYVYLTFIDKN